MGTLYNLTMEIESIMQDIMDAESGEEIAALTARLEEIEGDWTQKAGSYARVLKELEAREDALDREAKPDAAQEELRGGAGPLEDDDDGRHEGAGPEIGGHRHRALDNPPERAVGVDHRRGEDPARVHDSARPHGEQDGDPGGVQSGRGNCGRVRHREKRELAVQVRERICRTEF